MSNNVFSFRNATQGPYINYVGGGGGPEGFCGVMKYFRHILMGHEIFFKIFSGSQNIFLCSIFVILVFKLLRGLEHKIPKLAIKQIQERQDILSKSHLLSRYNEIQEREDTLSKLHPLSRYKANIGKNKKICLMHYDPDARVLCPLQLTKDTTL